MGKLQDAIYGFAIGDALGVPYEFKKRGTFECNDMVGHGTHNQPAGTWSDDTSMVLATMKSLANSEEIDLDDIMSEFVSWRVGGSYTPYGTCFDIGGTTASAIDKYVHGLVIEACGNTGEWSNGNGALMRMLPLAFMDLTAGQVDQIAELTHNTVRSNFFCEWYVKICSSIINNTFDPFDQYLGMIRNLHISELDSSGYVVGTFISALWCFLNTDNYKDCVIQAVNLGDDTDTVAAIAGGLAGLYYGIDAIPSEWINRLANKELIDKIIAEFNQKVKMN